MRNVKILAIICIFAMLLSLSGCAKKLEEKIAEKTVEKMLENAVGGKVDITTDDGMKIQTEDGEMKTGENLEWPKEAMGDLPIPKAKVTFVMKDNNNKNCTVTLSELQPEDAKAFLEKLIDMGFKDGMNMQADDLLMYTGKRADGCAVNFTYNNGPKEGVLVFEQPK